MRIWDIEYSEYENNDISTAILNSGKGIRIQRISMKWVKSEKLVQLTSSRCARVAYGDNALLLWKSEYCAVQLVRLGSSSFTSRKNKNHAIFSLVVSWN